MDLSFFKRVDLDLDLDLKIGLDLDLDLDLNITGFAHHCSAYCEPTKNKCITVDHTNLTLFPLRSLSAITSARGRPCVDMMSPGKIDEFRGSYEFIVEHLHLQYNHTLRNNSSQNLRSPTHIKTATKQPDEVT